MKNVEGSEVLFQTCEHRYGRGTEQSESWVTIEEGQCSGLNCVRHRSHVAALMPRTSECDCIWRQGLYRGN